MVDSGTQFCKAAEISTVLTSGRGLDRLVPSSDNRFFFRSARHLTGQAAGQAGWPDASVDLVAAGQAFHWFDRESALREFARILRSGAGGPGRSGRVALFWNSRRNEASPFLQDYEELLQRYGTDYREVDHTRIGAETLAPFFGGPYESRTFPNHQDLDFDGLRGRLRSVSCTPGPGHPDHEPMLEELRSIFDRHQEHGRVRMLYDTELYLGPLHEPR